MVATSILENRIRIPSIVSGSSAVESPEVFKPENSRSFVADEPDTDLDMGLSANVETRSGDDQYREYLDLALCAAVDHAQKLTDPQTKNQAVYLLTNSAVSGSFVHGVGRVEDVGQMIYAASKWRQVMNADEEIDVYEGILPSNYNAGAGYASLNEIAAIYDNRGLRLVEIARGHKDNRVFGSCVLPVSTNIITIHTVKDTVTGEVRILRWFAGKDINIRAMSPVNPCDPGEMLVKVNVKVPRVQGQPLVNAPVLSRRERASNWRNKTTAK